MDFGVGYFPTHDGKKPGTVEQALDLWAGAFSQFTGG
jgi:hypothetical protein